MRREQGLRVLISRFGGRGGVLRFRSSERGHGNGQLASLPGVSFESNAANRNRL